MKNKVLIITFLGALVVLYTSCSKDYLTTNPSTSIASSVVNSTTDNLNIALNSVHRYMYYGSFYGTQGDIGQATNIIMNDLLGEDYITTGSNWFGAAYQWTDHRSVNGTYNTFAWKFYYGIIGNVNVILGAVDNATGSAADKAQIKGECLAYRAWAHFNLVQFFAKAYKTANLSEPGIIVRTIPGDISSKARNTIQETYTQINKDLDDAMALLTASRSNKSHLNLAVAQGIKARVSLVQGNWVVAADMANKARTGYSPMTTAQYTAGFSDYSNPEWMWGSHQTTDANAFFSSWMAYCGNFSSTHNRTCPKVININLYNQISVTDIRKTLFDPTGTDQTFPIPTSGSTRRKYMQRKFLIAGTTYVPAQYYTVSGSSIGDVPLMRAGEMYLIEAEAKARLGDATAANVLFQLVSKRDPSYIQSVNVGTALINEILLQRRIELWGEGFRFTDLKRLNTGLDRTGATASDNSYSPLTTTVPVDDKKWQYLIPQGEIDANKLCIQNDL